MFLTKRRFKVIPQKWHKCCDVDIQAYVGIVSLLAFVFWTQLKMSLPVQCNLHLYLPSLHFTYRA